VIVAGRYEGGENEHNQAHNTATKIVNWDIKFYRTKKENKPPTTKALKLTGKEGKRIHDGEENQERIPHWGGLRGEKKGQWVTQTIRYNL